MWNLFRSLGSSLTSVYATALLLHAASLSLLPQRPTWLALIDTFALTLFLPLPLLVIIAALSRTRVALLATAISCTLFFGIYGYRFIPRAPEPAATEQSDGSSLTVLSNNLLASNRNSAQVLDVIRQEDPDVVALQELSEDMAAALRPELDAIYPYQVLEPAWTDGIGLFSRYPIRSERVLALSGDGHPDQVVQLDLPGGTITLMNVHLHSPAVSWYRRQLPMGSLTVPIGYDTAGRDRELVALAREIETISGPVVVVGDFNLPERSASYVWFSGRLQDSYSAVGYGFGNTFPQLTDTFIGPRRLLRRARLLGPLLRIDYVWHSADIATRSAHVAGPTGSDHRPVVARLVIEPTRMAQQTR